MNVRYLLVKDPLHATEYFSYISFFSFKRNIFFNQGRRVMLLKIN